MLFFLSLLPPSTEFHSARAVPGRRGRLPVPQPEGSEREPGRRLPLGGGGGTRKEAGERSNRGCDHLLRGRSSPSPLDGGERGGGLCRS